MTLTPELRDKIIEERLANYRRRFRAEHGTPLVCLGIGHDHKSGDLICCLLEDLPLAEMRNFLIAALKMTDDAIRSGKT